MNVKVKSQTDLQKIFLHLEWHSGRKQRFGWIDWGHDRFAFHNTYILYLLWFRIELQFLYREYELEADDHVWTIWDPKKED